MSFLIIAGAAIGTLTPLFDSILYNGELQFGDRFAARRQVTVPDEIKVLMPFKDGQVATTGLDTSAYYTFDGRVLNLVVSADVDSDVMENAGTGQVSKWREMIVYSDVKLTRSFVGQNAFGARTGVQAYYSRKITIGFDKTPGYDLRRISVRLPFELSGPAALSLAKAAALEITFSTDAKAVQDAKCKTHFYSATIDSPRQVSGMDCLVMASVRSARVIRRDTGEQLGVVVSPQ